MLRSCTKCGESHPLSFFNKDRTRADGVYPQCKSCTRANCKRVYAKYYDKHVEIKRKWKAENPEKHREINAAWRNANPDKVRENAARRRLREKRQTPPWADMDAIRAFHQARPAGYHVDHIVPLAGYNVSGLNTPANLQYLPADAHRKKGRCVAELEEYSGNL